MRESPEANAQQRSLQRLLQIECLISEQQDKPEAKFSSEQEMCFSKSCSKYTLSSPYVSLSNVPGSQVCES